MQKIKKYGIVSGCCLMLIASLAQGNEQAAMNGYSNKDEAALPVGLDLDNPIVVKEKFSSLEEVQKYQESFIKEKFPECIIRIETFTMGKHGEYIHFFTIKDPDDKFINIYFDLTRVYSKLKLKNHKMKQTISQLESNHKPMRKKDK